MSDFFCLHHHSVDANHKTLLLYRRIILPLLFSLCLISLSARGQIQDTVRFLNYNLLNYPAAGGSYSADTTNRHPHYRTIFNAIDADIIVVQEMTSQQGMDKLLTNVLNANTNTYSAGPFLNGYDTDNGIFFKTDKFHSPTNSAILTELRDISEFKLVHTLSGDTIRIYSLHLKASSGSTNEAQRAREVDSLRKVTNLLPVGTNFIVCGDFNIYNSSESSYQKLLQVTGGNEGHFIDPISMTGNWNQFAYRSHHTQSPRVRAFGGGSTGGLDDRFDLILYSKAIGQAGGMQYVPNSQIPYGNDGNLYNDSINNPSNSAVSSTIANALHYASDHIPVLSRFTIEYTTGSTPTDFGATALLDPLSPMCSNSNQTLSVRVKNFGALPVDLSVENLLVSLKITNPSAGISIYSETISSGTIAAGAVMMVNFTAVHDMSSAGNYSFLSYTTQVNDANATNDTLPAVIINVTTAPTASVSPAGPISFCNGDSVTLSAGSGVSYLWSNGQTTQNIIVSDTGNYSVMITLAGGCTSTSNIVEVLFITPPANGIAFYESMGTVGGTTSLLSHETNDGFDNDGDTMYGSADVRVTSPSSVYTGYSGAANVFFTNTAGRNFIISGINTVGFTNLVLSHGIHKSATAADGTELIVEVSTNGVDYTPLIASPLNTGSGTATWHYRTLSGTIPSSPTLSIQFRNTVSTAQFRVDDITLSGTSGTATISASGSTGFCQGDSVVLSASPGNTYHWNTGATTQDITVLSSGFYFVSIDCQNSDTVDVIVSNCQDVTLNLKAFIEGFYVGNQKMIAVADPVGNPGVCDTVTVQLAGALSPNNIAYTIQSLLDTNGTGSFVFPPSLLNNSFYIVVKHRNALETWSASPVLFNGTTINYDFTTSAGKAYGNNLVNVDGEFCFYSGDVTDGITDGIQDGIIDLNDFNSIENSLLMFFSGYWVYDLNGDRIVESSDFSLIGNNVEPFILLMRP